MDIEQARQFLRDNHNAVICTLRQNGEPTMSPITIGVDDEGYAIISSRETAFKVKHLRRDPRVWLCCLTRQFYGEWLLIRGRATIDALPKPWRGSSSTTGGSRASTPTGMTTGGRWSRTNGC